MSTVYTIGHSTHPLDEFLALLDRHGIDAIGDVRSSPFSRFNPWFNRETFEAALRERGVAYVFLGEELGARRSEEECYRGGTVDYGRVAGTEAFASGIARVIMGSQRFRIALMCAEHDPLTCHRTILVARRLRPLVEDVRHVLRDGSIETHAEAEERLLTECRLEVPDLFTPREDRLDDAYRRREREIAYAEKSEQREDALRG